MSRDLCEKQQQTDDNLEAHGLITPVPIPFLAFIDPPMVIDMTDVDTDSAHVRYRVRIMIIGAPGGSTPFEVPFAEIVPPSQTPSGGQIQSLSQFQMVGVPANPNADSNSTLFYSTMTLLQNAPSSQLIRSRIFIPPLATSSDANPVLATQYTAATPEFIRVLVPISSTQTVPVLYHHIVLNSSSSVPQHLFLQHPL